MGKDRSIVPCSAPSLSALAIAPSQVCRGGVQDGIPIVMILVDCALSDRLQVNCHRGSVTPSGEAYLTQPHADRVGMCFSQLLDCTAHGATVP